MTKDEFLRALSEALSPLGAAERKKTLAYYREMIEDRVESGMSEEEAALQMENVELIAQRLVPEEGARRKSGASAALIAIGSPLWLPLIAAGIAVAIALLVAALAVAIAICACELALGASAIALFIAFIASLSQNGYAAFAALGSSLALAGLTLFLYGPLRAAAAIVWRGSVSAYRRALHTLTKRTGR